MNAAAQTAALTYRRLLEATRLWAQFANVPPTPTQEQLTCHLAEKALFISHAALALQNFLGISLAAATARVLLQLTRDGDEASQLPLDAVMREIECEGSA